MHITELRLHQFRNFTSLAISPSSSFNLIYGLNGAGKSSVLEALHLLGFGRSFRTTKANTIVQEACKDASSFCRYNDAGEQKTLGINRNKELGFSFSIDGEKTRRISDLARRLPIQIFTPQSSDLILGAPMLRRRFVDWLLFHVEQSFYQANRHYSSAISQRNALLKQMYNRGSAAFKAQDVWAPILVEQGESITSFRKDYIKALNVELKALYAEFNPDVDIELRYNQGWDASQSLEESMEHKLERDLMRGSSSSGPHKADIQFLLSGKPASEYMSRGQLRVLVSLLLIAEVRVLKQKTGKSCIFLVDDIAAELDQKTREFFLDTIVSEDAQVFVTAIEKEQLSFAEKYNNKKVFHVKQNHVAEE